MEEKGFSVCRRIWRKSPDDIEWLFLEDAERTLSEGSQQEVLVAPEREITDFDLFDIGKTEQPVIADLVIHAVGDKVVTISIEKSIGAHELSAQPAGASRTIV